MLSRDTCQALAEAYPEEFPPRKYRMSTQVFWHRLGRVCNAAGREITERDRWFLREEFVLPNPRVSEETVWCPRLDELLAMAHRHVGGGSLRLESHATWWECGHADADGRGVLVTAGDAPEEAVAAWLLALAARKGAPA